MENRRASGTGGQGTVLRENRAAGSLRVYPTIPPPP